MIRATGLERGGRGPHRVVYAVTAEGREELGAWLPRPSSTCATSGRSSC